MTQGFHLSDVLLIDVGGNLEDATPRRVLLVGCGPRTTSSGVSRLLRQLEKRAQASASSSSARTKAKDLQPNDNVLSFVASLPPVQELPLRRVAVVRDLFDRDEVARPYLSSIIKLARDGLVVMRRSVAGRDSLCRRLVNEYVVGDESEKHYRLVQASVELKDYLEDSLGLRVLLADDHDFNTQESWPEAKECHASSTSRKAEVDTALGDKRCRLWDTNSAAVASRTTDTILMVAPIGFQLNEETAQDNHFMHRVKEESALIERKALAEFSGLHRALTEAGVKIILHAAERHHNTPDAVFPNNWFSTHSAAETGHSTLVYYPMKTPTRRAERRQSIISELQEVYEKEISFDHWENADPPRFLESTGVLILDRVRKVAYAARSQRCSKRVALQWAKRMGYQMCFFRATDARNQPIYHTNVMMALGTSVAVVCLESVADPSERDELERTLRASHELVEITREQIDEFCGNVLEVRGTDGKRVLAMSSRAFAAFTPNQKETLYRHVDELVRAPIETIETIGGGGVRCMMAEIF